MTCKTKLLPILSCAFYGLTSAAAHAQTTPATNSTPATPAQVAQTAPAAPAAQPPAAQPAAAPPATPPGPAPGSVSVTGLVDIYYEANARAPRAANGGPYGAIPTVGGGPIYVDNVGRAFDINDRDPSLNLIELNIVRTANKSFPFGITATITGGDTARLVHANEPGGTSSYEFIQQLYLTKVSHFWDRDFTFDFGEWVTPFGAEVIESSSNDNYTRSFGFTYGVPLYHAGLRMSVPIDKHLTFMSAIVNGWNNVADDNNAKSVIAGLTYKPTGNVTANFNFMGGAEGTGAFGAGIPSNGGGSITVDLGEFQPTWQASSKLKLTGDLVYARAAGTVLGVPTSGSWLSMAGYAKYQITRRFAVAARIEQFEDIPGAAGVGLRLGGGYTRLREATITLEYLTFKDRLVSRLEYRHDHSNTGFFGSGDGTPVNDQDTFVLGEVYKF